MCTFWLVEAMTRAGVYEPEYLARAVNLFENVSCSTYLLSLHKYPSPSRPHTPTARAIHAQNDI